MNKKDFIKSMKRTLLKYHEINFLELVTIIIGLCGLIYFFINIYIAFICYIIIAGLQHYIYITKIQEIENE